MARPDRDPVAFRTILICTLVAFFDGVDTHAGASLAPVIAVSMGVPVSSFGIAFSAGLLGMAIGSFLFGSLADRFGRKEAIVAAIVVFGGGTLLTASTSSLGQFVAVRFLTGLGIGGVLPNLLALSAACAPERSRALVLNLMYCGYPLGGVAFGITGSLAIDTLGWRGIYVLCGALSLLLVVIVQGFMPRTVPTGADSAPLQSGESRGGLFAGGFAKMTLLLWLATFLSLFIVIFVVSWCTTLLTRDGMTIRVALLYPPLFSLGGIFGSLAIGVALDRSRSLIAAAMSMAAGAGCLLLVMLTIHHPVLLGCAVAAAGFFVVGAQTGLQAASSSLYPDRVRSTALGWSLGVGRFGSLVAPLVGSLLIAWNWDPGSIFAALVGPAVIAAGTICILSWVAAARSDRPDQGLVQ